MIVMLDLTALGTGATGVAAVRGIAVERTGKGHRSSLLPHMGRPHEQISMKRSTDRILEEADRPILTDEVV